MLFFTIVKVALRSLIASKLRSFLAVLGIIIGVGAVISMLAMGAGAQKQVMGRISAMGTNLLVVRSGQHGLHGVSTGTFENLTIEDAQALIREVSDIAMLAPVVQGGVQVKYMNKNSRINVLGTTITYPPIRDFKVESGHFFTEGESESNARVAVLGPTTVENLFGKDDPLGEMVKVNGINFKVIGVLKAKGDQGWYSPDDQALIPISTAMKQVLGVDNLREIDIQAREGSDLMKAQASITEVLRRRHKLRAEAADDFEIRNQAEIIETASSVTRTFTILLAAVAGISLLVGGIGIMNIMLVTVTERTREIGIRKAIGAKNRDILTQFLLESVIMSAVGGSIGVVFGVGTAFLIGRVTQFSTEVEISSIVLSLSFSAAVGIFFGFYPARRAALLDPIEALRYE